MAKLGLLLLIALPLLGSLALLPSNRGLWWDEAVYIGLAQGLAQGRYSLDPAFAAEGFRPPLFPLALLPFREGLSPAIRLPAASKLPPAYAGEGFLAADGFLAGSDSIPLARLFALATAVLAILATALLAERMQPPRAYARDSWLRPGSSLWAAALLATASSFVFFSSKALSEPLFIALAALSVWSFRPSQKSLPTSGDGWLWLFLSGLLAGLAVLTRYFGLLLVLAELLVLLFLKARSRASARAVLAWLAGIALLLAPWTALTSAYGPLGAIGANFAVYAGVANPDIPGFGLLGSLGFAGLFAILGLAVLVKERSARQRDPPDRGRGRFCAANTSASLAALVAILAVASFLLLPNREPRYLVSFLGFFAALGGLGLRWLSRWRWLPAIAVVLLLLSAGTGLAAQRADRDAGSSLLQAAAFVAGRTAPDDIILTTSPPYLAVAGRRGMGLCGPEPATNCTRSLIEGTWDPIQLGLQQQQFSSRWLVLSRFEPTTPPYLFSYAEAAGWRKAAAFAQWGEPEATVVYERE